MAKRRRKKPLIDSDASQYATGDARLELARQKYQAEPHFFQLTDRFRDLLRQGTTRNDLWLAIDLAYRMELECLTADLPDEGPPPSP